jgi:hypothetical protein
MIDLIYYMFYCSAGNDGTKSKHEMVAYGMEIVATQILSFFTFIILGALNIKVSVFLLWILIIGTNAVFAYFLVNGYYIKSGKYHTILEKYATTSNRTRTFYKTIVILLFIISFVLLFVGGIIMSYLLSLYE